MSPSCRGRPEEPVVFERLFQLNARDQGSIKRKNTQQRTGCHHFQVIEDTYDALQFNITYCAWWEIAKLLGVEKACTAHCHADDVFLPNFLSSFGVVFKRTTTLARGGDFCDFRYERMYKEIAKSERSQIS